MVLAGSPPPSTVHVHIRRLARSLVWCGRLIGRGSHLVSGRVVGVVVGSEAGAVVGSIALAAKALMSRLPWEKSFRDDRGLGTVHSLKPLKKIGGRLIFGVGRRGIGAEPGGRTSAEQASSGYGNLN